MVRINNVLIDETSITSMAVVNLQGGEPLLEVRTGTGLPAHWSAETLGMPCIEFLNAFEEAVKAKEDKTLLKYMVAFNNNTIGKNVSNS